MKKVIPFASLFLAMIVMVAGCSIPVPPAQSESFDEQMARARREGEERARARDAHQERDRLEYVAAHDELKPAIRDAILNHQVIIGMTYEQAWKSLGGGHDFHSVETANGRADEFTYQDMRLIFVNSVLSEIQR